MRILPIIVFILCFLPATVKAHSFYRYVSTPITPPREFIWLFWVYVALFVTINILVNRRFLGASLVSSVLLSVGFLTCFIVTFFLFGSFAASLTTAPPPGLGMPSPTFWGFDWAEAGNLFIAWNFYGFLFLGVWCLIFYKPWSSNGTGRWVGMFCNIMLYFFCVIPYMVSGALLHGWAGDYVNNGCGSRLEKLNNALLKYAEQHNEQLPEANGIDSLLVKLKPYLETERLFYSTPILVCPKGGAYERVPKQYEWNSKFSGVKLQDIDLEQFTFDVELINCPYHEGMGSRTSYMLTEFIKEVKNKNTPKKTSTVNE